MRFDCESGAKYVVANSQYTFGERFQETYFAVTAFVKGTLPVIIITIVTALLVRFLQKRHKARHTLFAETSVNKQQRHELDNLTKCFAALIVSFLVLVVPFTLWSVVSHLKPKTCSITKAGYVFQDFILLNSAVNFFIYCWKLAPFRQAIQKVCHCTCEKNNVPPEAKLEVYSVESPHTSTTNQ